MVGTVQDLTLDPAIRDWVLLPLSAILLLAGLVRHYVSQAIAGKPKPQPLLALREQRAITRGQLLRANGSHLPPSAFASLKTHLSKAYDDGSYLKAPASADGQAAPPPNPLGDPAAMEGMMDMLKKQAVGFLPQTILMYYINSFFSGFLLTRLPFPLPPKFKELLQRGIDVPDLDASWCSAISWYFLCLFGLNPVYQLLLGEDNAASDLAAMNPAGMMGGGGAAMPTMPGQPAQDFSKMFRAEKENLEIVEYVWVCEGVEERLLKKYGAGTA
ncbi:hypothetical protein JCM10207_009010 [Rhodosporidiobolus poonsookiae]